MNPTLLRVLLLLQLLFLSADQMALAQEREFKITPLETIAAETPDREVEIVVEFKAIQRSPDIIKLLDNSGLRLVSIRFKNVGSGGGEISSLGPYPFAPYESVAKALSKAEQWHRQSYESRIRDPAEYRDLRCEFDDVNSPVRDTHGIPGEPEMEAVCGLRINGLKLTGSAAAAFAFREVNSTIAKVSRTPTMDEYLQLLESMIQGQPES